MKYHKDHTFFPDIIGLLFVTLALLFCFQARAAEVSDNIRFEKIFYTLEMDSISGKNLKLSNFSTDYVIVNFWASWCIPCLHEIPSLIKAFAKMTKEKLTVVMINTDETDQLKNIQKIKGKLKLPDDFIIIPDKKFKIADEFKFNAIPVTVIFKKGKVFDFNNGPVDFEKALSAPPDMR